MYKPTELGGFAFIALIDWIRASTTGYNSGAQAADESEAPEGPEETEGADAEGQRGQKNGEVEERDDSLVGHQAVVKVVSVVSDSCPK